MLLKVSSFIALYHFGPYGPAGVRSWQFYAAAMVAFPVSFVQVTSQFGLGQSVAKMYLLEPRDKVQVIRGDGNVEEVALKDMKVFSFQTLAGNQTLHLRNKTDPRKGMVLDFYGANYIDHQSLFAITRDDVHLVL